MRDPEQRTGQDRGSATVLAMGLIGVLLSLGIAALVLASAVVASHRARSAADLAALAGASAVLRGAPAAQACAAAREVVRANVGRLTACNLTGASVEVVVEVQPSVRHLGAAVARARAGPPSAALSR